jgi:hypothetical protein
MTYTTVIKCKPTKLYVERSPYSDFTWHVYNVSEGYIVASTYSKIMAETILFAMKDSGYYPDEYAITETWKSPEHIV